MEPERDAVKAEQESRAPGSKAGGRRIGLVLSGGGFRATLFHLGVIRFLKDQDLLPDVKHICSVSGGSIMAAHLVANWLRYNAANPKPFDEAAKELYGFIRQDIRDLVLRRFICALLAWWWVFLGVIAFQLGVMAWLSSYVPISRGDVGLLIVWALVGVGTFLVVQFRNWSRIGLLQNYYDSHLYLKTALKDLKDRDETCPTIDLLATSLTMGRSCGFTTYNQAGFWWRERNKAGETNEGETKEEFLPNENLPIALGVAASSAFPAVFPPVKVNRRILHNDKGEFETQYLADGGVFDNLGVSRIQQIVAEKGDSFDHIFVSDAEGYFSKVQKRGFGLLTERARRTSDILMSRVSTLENAKLKGKKEYVFCKISKTVKKDLKAGVDLSKESQARLKGTRTDLNVFSDSEVYYLAKHGYAVTRQAWANTKKEPLKTATDRVWEPDLPTKAYPEALDRLEQQSLTKLWFDWRDPVCWWNVSLLVAPLLLLAVYFFVWLWWAPKPVGIKPYVHFTDPSEVTGDSAWLHPILISLTAEGKDEQEGLGASSGDFRIVTVTTAPLGRYTRGVPAAPFQVEVSAAKRGFLVTGGYAFRVSGAGARAVYRPLPLSMVSRRSEDGTPPSGEGEQSEVATTVSEGPRMRFTVPESGPHDALFMIIRVAISANRAASNAITTNDANQLVKLEVR